MIHHRRICRRSIRQTIGNTVRRTNVAGRNDYRAFHRDFTARLLRSNCSVHAIRRLLNRGSIGAAVVCARILGQNKEKIEDPLS